MFGGAAELGMAAVFLSLVTAVKDSIDRVRNYPEYQRTKGDKLDHLQQQIDAITHNLNRVIGINPNIIFTTAIIQRTQRVFAEINSFTETIEAEGLEGFFSQNRTLERIASFKRELDGITTVISSELITTLVAQNSQLLQTMTQMAQAFQANNYAGARAALTNSYANVRAAQTEQHTQLLQIQLFSGHIIPANELYVPRTLQLLVTESQRESSEGAETKAEAEGSETTSASTWQPIEAARVFDNQQRVTLVSEAGSGASMEAVQLYAQAAELWPQFDWVFFIPLKEVALTLTDRGRPYSFAEILHAALLNQHPLNMSLDEARAFCQSLTQNMDKVLFIVDDRDAIHHAFVNTLLSAARNTLTIRNTSALQSCTEVTIALTNFGEEDLLAYINKFYQSCAQANITVDEQRSIGHLLTWLEEHPGVKKLCQKPLIAQLICELWIDTSVNIFEGDNFQLHRLFETITEKVLLRYLDQFTTNGITNITAEQQRPVQVVKNILMKLLAKLAFFIVSRSDRAEQQAPINISIARNSLSGEDRALLGESDIISNLTQLNLFQLVSTEAGAETQFIFRNTSICRQLVSSWLADNLTDDNAINFIRNHKFNPELFALFEATAAKLATHEHSLVKLNQFFNLLLSPPRDLSCDYERQLLLHCYEACDCPLGLEQRDALLNDFATWLTSSTELEAGANTIALESILRECPTTCTQVRKSLRNIRRTAITGAHDILLALIPKTLCGGYPGRALTIIKLLTSCANYSLSELLTRLLIDCFQRGYTSPRVDNLVAALMPEINNQSARVEALVFLNQYFITKYNAESYFIPFRTQPIHAGKLLFTQPVSSAEFTEIMRMLNHWLNLTEASDSARALCDFALACCVYMDFTEDCSQSAFDYFMQQLDLPEPEQPTAITLLLLTRLSLSKEQALIRFERIINFVDNIPAGTPPEQINLLKQHGLSALSKLSCPEELAERYAGLLDRQPPPEEPLTLATAESTDHDLADRWALENPASDYRDIAAQLRSGKMTSTGTARFNDKDVATQVQRYCHFTHYDEGSSQPQFDAGTAPFSSEGVAKETKLLMHSTDSFQLAVGLRLAWIAMASSRDRFNELFPRFCSVLDNTSLHRINEWNAKVFGANLLPSLPSLTTEILYDLHRHHPTNSSLIEVFSAIVLYKNITTLIEMIMLDWQREGESSQILLFIKTRPDFFKQHPRILRQHATLLLTFNTPDICAKYVAPFFSFFVTEYFKRLETGTIDDDAETRHLQYLDENMILETLKAHRRADGSYAIWQSGANEFSWYDNGILHTERCQDPEAFTDILTNAYGSSPIDGPQANPALARQWQAPTGAATAAASAAPELT